MSDLCYLEERQSESRYSMSWVVETREGLHHPNRSMTMRRAGGGEEKKWLGRKGSASWNALGSACRFQHHGALISSTV